MGYNIRQVPGGWTRIPANKRAAAFRAVRALTHPEGRPPRDWQWVTARETRDLTTLPDLLRAWGWSCTSPAAEDENVRDVTNLHFENEKGGYEQEDALMNALGPYVDVGGYVEFVGEDGERWRYRFDGERAYRERGINVWLREGF